MAAKFELSVCAIFQDDAPFLSEWIEFHTLQGAQHFYLYNNCSTDNYLEVLHPYIDTKKVTLVEWPYLHNQVGELSWNSIQCAAYIHCLQNFGEQSKWMAFIDTDEFLFCPSGKLLTKFLKRYENFGGVVANWLMFGPSNIYDIPPNKLMIELLTSCAPRNHIENIHVKSIVQPRYTIDCTCPHFFLYVQNKCSVETDFTPIEGSFSSSIKLDQLRINHYWTRTGRYLHEFKIPRRIHTCAETSQDIQNRVDAINIEKDTSILQFVPKLKKKMGF